MRRWDSLLQCLSSPRENLHRIHSLKLGSVVYFVKLSLSKMFPESKMIDELQPQNLGIHFQKTSTTNEKSQDETRNRTKNPICLNFIAVKQFQNAQLCSMLRTNPPSVCKKFIVNCDAHVTVCSKHLPVRLIGKLMIQILEVQRETRNQDPRSLSTTLFFQMEWLKFVDIPVQTSSLKQHSAQHNKQHKI